jgi:death-on-curing protein
VPVVYLTALEIVAIHDALIEVFGGTFGIRDLGALQGAVYRPQSGYYQDRIDEAAALWESLILNHPFLDGNKRTAVAAADIHLRLNGFVLDVPSAEAADFVEELFRQSEMRISRIEPWLRARVREF